MDAPTTSRHDIRRVLIAGDTHGNTARVEILTRTAAAEGCAVITQVGDLGYFPNFPDGPGFLATTNADRTTGIDWWPSETTDLSDVALLGDDDLDVLISHDAPTGLDLADRRLPAEDQIRADEVRSLIASAVEATRLQIVFHGHWHRAHDTELSWIDGAETERTGTLTWCSTRIIGLGCDGDINGGWLVLDLGALGVRLPSTEWPSLRVEP